MGFSPMKFPTGIGADRIKAPDDALFPFMVHMAAFLSKQAALAGGAQRSASPCMSEAERKFGWRSFSGRRQRRRAGFEDLPVNL